MNYNKKKLLWILLSVFNGIYLLGSAAQNIDSNIGFMTPVRVKNNSKPSDHDMNQSHIKKITDIFQSCGTSIDILSLTSGDIDLINNLSKIDFQRLETQLNFIRNTPGRTKHSIVQSLVKAYKNFISDYSPDAVVQNDKIYDDYILESHITKLINKSLSLLDSPDRRDLSAVDTKHVMDADIKHDQNGSISKISGGHFKDSYLDHTGTFLGDSKGFLSPDGKTMGLSFSNKIGKTVEDNLSPEQIISNLRRGQIIAIDSSGMQIRYISRGKFVGCYVDVSNPLQVKTQFPILTISYANMNRDGLLYVGNLVEFQPDGSLVDDASSSNLYLTQAQFNAMMDDSSLQAFIQEKSGVVVKDLTNVLQQHFSKELHAFGMIKFPAPIYGIVGVERL